jgi:succinate-semialdehyde dehydrogenase/glutarate-semialdehyde dehydrogenase
MKEETFAPVAPVAVFDDEDEVIRRANDTEYGLAAYVFTENLNRAWRVAEALEAGTVGVNDSVPSTSQCPFGGMKQSGLGRELGTEGLDAFLETKHISFGQIG